MAVKKRNIGRPSKPAAAPAAAPPPASYIGVGVAAVVLILVALVVGMLYSTNGTNTVINHSKRSSGAGPAPIDGVPERVQVGVPCEVPPCQPGTNVLTTLRPHVV